MEKGEGQGQGIMMMGLLDSSQDEDIFLYRQIIIINQRIKS